MRPKREDGRPIKKLIVVLLLALAVAPAAAAARTTASDFAGQWYRWLSNGQWDRMYTTLHPAQQAFVTRDRFVACYQKAEIPAFDVLGWKTVDVLHVKTLIPGTKMRSWSTVVTLRVKLKDPDTGRTESGGHTAHLFLVKGHWRWIVPASDASAFKAGRCPA